MCSYSEPFAVLLFIFGGFVRNKNKVPAMNNKLANSLTLFAVFGAIISLFSSIYIGHNLKERGYKVCSKASWVAPNEYVRDLKLCP